MDDDPRPETRSFEPLTQRERDILALLAENLSDREISDRLVLAYTTVKWYNRRIFTKLGVENRQQAVQRASDIGLLEQPKYVNITNYNLPAQLTSFIGRVSELEDLIRLLSHPTTRLVTILASGGMGKTRLAQAAAENVLGRFAEGVYFVPLAPVTSPDHLIPTIADCTGLRFVADNRTPKQQLLDFLRSKRVLLVLDNFEHLLEGAFLVADILQAAPGVKAFVTSRERLNLAGETIYTLRGMSYPDPIGGEDLLDYDAVQLFVESARRADPHFVTHDEVNIIRVCQLVQGMPLALEMAAAWVRIMAPAEIADEIAQSADFLRTTQRNLPERLRSVRAVFEATWKRLTDQERQVFRRLSVFRGGCTREAARIIAGADLGTLAALADKALLWHKPEDGRYEVHELLRQYAAAQLETAGEAEAAQNAHRDYFAQRAHEWGKALKTPKQLRALAVLDGDVDNIREAFRRAIETRSADVIEPFTDLWYFYEVRGWYTEGEKTLGTAIDRLIGQDSVALGKLLAGQGHFDMRLNRLDQARVSLDKSIDMLHRMDADHETWMPLLLLGNITFALGNLESASILFREAFEVAQRYDDQWEQSASLCTRGMVELVLNHFDAARDFLTQAYLLCTNLGNVWWLGYALRDLAYLAYEAGDYEEARRLYTECRTNAQKTRHLMNVSAGLGGLRAVALAQGELLQARHFAEDALRIERDLGNTRGMFFARLGLAEVATASGSYPEARRYLWEALRLLGEFEDSTYILRFVMMTVPVLVQTDAREQAVTLMSFLDHHPRRDRLTLRDQETLRKLGAQLRSELPADLYVAVWDQGQTLMLDNLLNTLRVLL